MYELKIKPKSGRHEFIADVAAVHLPRQDCVPDVPPAVSSRVPQPRGVFPNHPQAPKPATAKMDSRVDRRCKN